MGISGAFLMEIGWFYDGNSLKKAEVELTINESIISEIIVI